MITIEELTDISLTKEMIENSLQTFDKFGSFMVYYNIYSGDLYFEKGSQYFGAFLCEVNISKNQNINENIELIFEKYISYKSRMNIKYLSLQDVSCKSFYKDIISGNISLLYFSENDPNYKIIKRQLINKLQSLNKKVNEDIINSLDKG